MNKPAVSIVGYGRLGQNLCRWLLHAGYKLEGVFNRSTMPMHPELFQARTQGTFPAARRELGDMLLICVKDDAIVDVARRLEGLPLEGLAVVHTSGAIPAEAMGFLRDHGAHVASMHPLQTFGGLSKKSPFRGISASLEGDRPAIDTITQMVRDLGATPLLTDATGKALMHLACVWASNYVHVLLDAAVSVGRVAGVSPAQTMAALQPLLLQTVANAVEQGSEQSLTGPASRGDVGTVLHHLRLMDSRPELQTLYRSLAEAAASIAVRRGSLSNEGFADFTRDLEGRLGGQ